jgi:hypothetical protein
MPLVAVLVAVAPPQRVGAAHLYAFTFSLDKSG